jgi:hypothetical protein
VQVINTDHVLATLTDNVPFMMEMVVENGRGYVPATEHSEGDHEIGIIPVDAVFSPVIRVRYEIEETRVGQKTNYDKLTMEIWTDGSVSPEMALVESAKILRKHLNPFVQYNELGPRITAPPRTGGGTMDAVLDAKLNMSLAELKLSVRAMNCLESADITSVRDLVQKDGRPVAGGPQFWRDDVERGERATEGSGAASGDAVGADVPDGRLISSKLPQEPRFDTPLSLLSPQRRRGSAYPIPQAIMRHRKRGRHLGRSSSHRKAMLKNLASSLFLTERQTDADWTRGFPKSRAGHHDAAKGQGSPVRWSRNASPLPGNRCRPRKRPNSSPPPPNAARTNGGNGATASNGCSGTTRSLPPSPRDAASCK